MKVGDVVVLRKPHPCGGREWEITRTGADFRLRCLRCGREIWLSRAKLKRLVVRHGVQNKDISGRKGETAIL